MTARPLTPVTPARPVSSPSAGRSPISTRRFVHLVRSAVNQRQHLVRCGKSQPVVLWRLEQWLRDNPYPSLRTIAAFPLFDDLAQAMPHHAPGQHALDEARCIMRGIPYTK